MIAVPIAPNMRMAVVGAPSYFRNAPKPKRPQDLIGHNCINLRLPTHGGLYAWEFEKGGRELKVRVDGQLTFNTTAQMLNAALVGIRPDLCAGGIGGAVCGEAPADTGFGRLVPAVFRLSPLVSEPATAVGCVLSAGGGAAVSGLTCLVGPRRAIGLLYHRCCRTRRRQKYRHALSRGVRDDPRVCHKGIQSVALSGADVGEAYALALVVEPVGFQFLSGIVDER